jgi:hypothetical protein
MGVGGGKGAKSDDRKKASGPLETIQYSLLSPKEPPWGAGPGFETDATLQQPDLLTTQLRRTQPMLIPEKKFPNFSRSAPFID